MVQKAKRAEMAKSILPKLPKLPKSHFPFHGDESWIFCINPYQTIWSLLEKT
jgi:hypothetical protein